MLRCVHCGKAMCGHNVKTKYGRIYFYACYQCEEMGQHKRCSVSMMEIDKVLIERIKNRFFSSDRVNNTLKVIKEKLKEQKNNPGVNLANIENRMKEIDAKANKLLDTIDTRHKDLLNLKLDEFKREKDMLLAEKDRATRERIDFDIDKVAREILLSADEFKKVLKIGSPAEKKQYVRSYIGQILIDSDTKHAKVGFYPIPRIPSTEPLLNAVSISSGATASPI